MSTIHMRRIVAPILSLLLVVLPVTPSLAGSLSITGWSTGDQLNSVNLNSRMTSITTWANGNISDTNISATAAIAGSKLDLTSSTGRISHSTSVTSDAPVFTSGQTWDNVANVFSMWRGTVTNTNSASTSRLIDLRLGSTIIASISRVGQLMLTPQAYASGPSTLLEGAWFNIASATYTDNMTAASGTAPRFIAYAFQRPALAAGNSSVTTTRAATVFIASAPVAGDNMTLTNRYALWVDQGNSLFGGGVDVLGNPPAPRGYIDGLTLSNDGSDATNDFGVAVGVARDSSNARTMQLLSALVKRTDAIFGIGTNQGCLDTGTVGNGTYHIFLIASASNATPDAICSTSATTPSVPHADWASVRRVGSIVRTGGAIVGFVQVEDRFDLKVPINSIDTTNPGTSAVTATLVNVPALANLEARIGVAFGTGSGGGVNGLITALDTTDTAPSDTVNHFKVPVSANGGSEYLVRTNATPAIRYRTDFSDGSTIIRITTIGWVDKRGKS